MGVANKKVFFFKQKTAYGIYQCDWSSDVCSSDLIKKSILSPNDIISVKNPPVTPYVYTSTCSLAMLPISEKKQKFFDMMLPAILVAKTNLDLTRKEVEVLSKKKKLSYLEKNSLNRLMKKFKTNNIQLLIRRLHTFPVSIVLAQAAIESGWGSSRFFLQANNPFGIWSFNTKHSRVAASSTDRKSTRLNSSHTDISRMPSSA